MEKEKTYKLQGMEFSAKPFTAGYYKESKTLLKHFENFAEIQTEEAQGEVYSLTSEFEQVTKDVFDKDVILPADTFINMPEELKSKLVKNLQGNPEAAVKLIKATQTYNQQYEDSKEDFLLTTSIIVDDYGKKKEISNTEFLLKTFLVGVDENSSVEKIDYNVTGEEAIDLINFSREVFKGFFLQTIHLKQRYQNYYKNISPLIHWTNRI